MQDYIPRETDINGEIGTVVVKQYDNLSRYIHLQIMDNDLSAPMNLVGCEVRLYVDLLEDIGYIDGEVADGEKGIITFLLPNGVTQKEGRYQAEVWITNADETSVISTKPFTIDVGKSLRDERRLEATGQFSALENALFQVAINKARINAMTSLADSGSVEPGTVDSEVVDIRTGYDGSAYPTAGEAVRGQIQEIHDSVATMAEFLAVLDEDYEENEEVNTLISDLQAVLKEANAFRYQIAVLRREVENIAQSTTAGSLAEHEKVTALASALETLSDEMTALKEQISGITSSLSGSAGREEMAELSSDLRALSGEVNTLKGQITSITNQIETLGSSSGGSLTNGSITNDTLSAALQYPNNIISTGTVAAMLDCAESYFNYAYTADGQDSGIIYESNRGLYSPSLGKNASGGQYSIVCSSFVNAVVNGIYFENSRYTGRTKNIGHRWGLVFDDTVEFGKTIGDWSTQDDIDAHNFEAEQRYLISSALAKYAAEHDCLYMIDGKQNIRAGDVLFSRKKDYYPATQGAHVPSQDNYYPYPTDNFKPYAFMGIDHVSIAVNVSGDYVTLMEAWPSQKADGKDVGVRISYRNLITQPIGESVYICGATLPIGDAGYIPNVEETQFDHSGDTSATTQIYEFKRKVKKGFYTVVCHGTLSSEPYIFVKYDGNSSYTRQDYMHQIGNDYYLTVYVQKPGKLSVQMGSNNTYNIDEMSLYKGYADMTCEQQGLNSLTAGDDLDDCYEGEWYCRNKAAAEAIVHAPLSEAPGGFRLEAKRMTNGERYMQTLWYANSPGAIYTRMYLTSGWSEWLVFLGKTVS